MSCRLCGIEASQLIHVPGARECRLRQAETELSSLRAHLALAEQELAHLKLEASGMGRLLQSGVVIPTAEYSTMLVNNAKLRADLDAAKGALDRIADGTVSMDRPQFTTWDLRTVASEALAKLNREGASKTGELVSNVTNPASLLGPAPKADTEIVQKSDGSIWERRLR